MNRNNSASSIMMTKEMVASIDPDDLKSRMPKRGDDP
jgi:hypothetical protein